MAEPDLTLEQTHEFLSGILGIPKELHSSCGNVRFLNTLIGAWADRLPYQNVTQVLLTKHHGRLATKAEVVREQLAGRGGVCIYHAYFMYRVLGSLGFHARLVPSAVIAPYDHAIVTVRDVEEKGDEYLVEVGGGFPTLEAVPLHQLRKSETATIVYQQAGLEFKYVLRGDTLSRYHRFGADPKHITDVEPHDVRDTEGGWNRFYDCELRDFDVDEAFAPSTQISRCLVFPDDRYFFLKHVRAVLTLHGRRLVAVKGDELLIQDDESGRQTTLLANEQERWDTFRKHFPMIDTDQVAEATQYISQIMENRSENQKS